MRTFPETPDEYLDFGVDWSVWLEPGDRITGSTWTADSGITIADGGFDDRTTRVWASGGAPDTDYLLTNRITTAQGRTAERTLRIRVVTQRAV